MLDYIRGMLQGNSNGLEITTQEIIDIKYRDGPVITIYPTDKYACWHGEFHQIATLDPALNKLVDYLDRQGYEQNLD